MSDYVAEPILAAPICHSMKSAEDRSVPTILFLANALGPEKRVEAPEGGKLVDICDKASAPIPFSCRSASCATCQIEIVEGGDLFEPPNADELELLELLDAPKANRLACQARVRGGTGVIRLRPV
jgi:2Fe-2S ferredoxin